MNSRLTIWALRYALRRRAALPVVLGAMLLKIVLDVLKPWPLKILVDYVLGEKSMPAALAQSVEFLPGAVTREDLLTWCVIATVILFLLGWALNLASSYANIGFGQRMVYDLAADLFGHLQYLSLRFHGRRSVGDFVRRVTTDCGCVATIVKDVMLPAIVCLVSLVVMFVIMWRMDALLTLLALAVTPCMIVILRRYAGPMLKRSYEQQEAEARTYEVVERALSAMPVVQAFGQEPRNDDRFRKQTDAVLATALAATNVQLQFKVLTGLTLAVGTASILWVGARHVMEGRLSVGSILVFLSYLASLYGPLEVLMYTSSTFQGAAGSAKRVREILETEPDVQDRPGARPLPPVKGHIRLEQVSFGYEPDRQVLCHVSLEVLPGQTVAIVGPTGAGKTTLVSLVPRFFDPLQGRVLLDGHDVRDVTVKSLREQVGLVLQEPFLFPLTIAENIAYGRPGALQADIEAAARAANLHEFIQRLPRGYDTVVGERGATLSGGERQRLSIARALLKDAPVLILDEPTSALDAQTERLVLEALERLMHGRTTLIIAHRLSTVRHADQIVVVRDGSIVESGTHRELLALGKSYAGLHSIQFGLPAEVPIAGGS